MTYNPKWLENSPDTQLGGFNGTAGSNNVVPTQGAVKSFIYDLTGDVQDPSGIANRDATSLYYDTTSTPDRCTVFIAPDTEDIEAYVLGKKFVFNTAQSVVLDDIEGTHYVYFNENGVLTSTNIFDRRIITEWAYVAAVYWNAVAKDVNYFGDERHGINMAGDTHFNLHRSQGTIYLSGLALADINADSTSAVNADAQFSVTAGEILDEDISNVIPSYPAPADVFMYYLSGSSLTRHDTTNDYALVNTGTGRVAWNEFTGGSWQLTEATNGYFVLSHIFATNDVYNPIVGLVGQGEYATLTEARNAAETEINSINPGDLPFQEFVVIATVIFETSDSFANTPKAIIRSTNTGGDYQDWRTTNLNPKAGSPTDHGQLSGLADDDHLQYAILSGLRPFSGEQEFAAGINVSAGDISVANNTVVDVSGTDVASFGSDTQQLGVTGDTFVNLTQSTDTIGFTAGNTTVATMTDSGIQLASGATITEFSTDGTLVDNSDTAVPTEQAVKTYVDTVIAAFSLNRIYEGDSEVIVDDTTAAGEIRISADNTEVASFTASTVKLGDPVDSNGANLTVGSTSGILIQEQDVQYFFGQGAEIIVGRNDDGLYLDLLNDLAVMTTGTEVTSIWTSDTQIFGRPQVAGPYPGNLGAGVTVEQGAIPSVTIHASADNYLVISDSTGSTPTTPEPTTMRYYDQGAEMLRVNSAQQLFGDLDNNIDGQFFGMDFTNNGPSSGFVYEQNTVNYLDVRAANQRLGSAAGPHALMFAGETFPAAIYTDTNENIGLQLSNTNLLLGQNNNTRVNVNLTSDNIVFYSTTTAVGTFAASGLSLQNGTNINEFSTDTNLGGLSPSNDAVPTEAAVKTYVDNAIGGAVSHNSTTGIQGGDSTAVEYYHVIQDVYLGIYASGSVIGFGSDTGTNLEVDYTTHVITADLNGTEVFDLTETAQRIGVSGDTYVNVDQTLNQVSITAGNESQILVETTGTTVYDDLTVTGDLFVDGTTFVVNNQEVTTSDNIIVINNGEVGPGVTAGSAGIEVDRGTETNYQFLFVEASDTFRIGEVGSLQAVATREDSPADTRVPWWNDTQKRFDTLGDDYITVNTSTHVISFGITSEQGKFDSNGLTLASGASVNEFSIDGTLSGDSNDAVPTEQAVKTYVDNQIGNISTNKIEEGDSYVIVNDGTGGAGEVSIVVDGVEVGYYNALATSQRLGKADGSFVLTADDSVTISDPNVVEVFSALENTFRIGYWTDAGPYLSINRETDPALVTLAADPGTYLQLDSTTSAQALIYVDNVEYVNIDDTEQRFGGSSVGHLLFNAGETFTVGLYTNGSENVGVQLNDTIQLIGQNSNTRVNVNQTSDEVAIYSTATAVGTFGATGLTLTSGATVNEFSTDGTLAGNSNTAVPTEQAVKSYVDSAVGDVTNVRFVSSDTTAAAGDIVLVDSTAGPVNIELLETSDGRIVVKKITNDSNTVTIFTSPGTIDGQATSTIDTPYQAYAYVSDGSDFYII